MNAPHALAKENKELYLQTFGELYEHSIWVIEDCFLEVAQNSLYDDLEEYHKLLSRTMLQASSELQDALIKAHPMLAGKKAMANELTDFSTNEQKSAGLSDCTQEEIAQFDELNQTYLQTFGFPFILAVKGKNKEEIISNFELRLTNSLEVETKTALEQINSIAWIRIKDIYDK